MRQLTRCVFIGAILAVGLGLAAGPADAQRRPVVRGPRGNVRVVHPKARHVFRATDHGLFRNYYRTHRIVVTPLAPEVVKLLLRGKPLPVGIVRLALAPEVLVLVPPPAVGYEYAIVGDRIVMLDDEGLVADILDDVFP